MDRVFKKFALTALAVTLSLSAASCGRSTGGGNAGTDVAATVNGQKIMLSDVDRIVNQQAQGQKLPTLETAAARLQVLDKLIERHVLYERAQKEKTVPADDEVNTFVNQQRQQGTVEEWEKRLKESNLTEEQLREEARKDIAINKLQEKLYGQINVREQEISDFYANNKERFVTPRGVALADIVVDPRDSAGAYEDDAKSEAEAAAKIQRLYQTLRNGADFGDVARSSEDPSRVRGGDIGVANEDALRQNGFPQDLIGRFFNQMPIGSYTEPIRFADGRWYIFKVTNRQLENRPLTLEDPGVREQIKEALVNQRKTILTEALIRNAMSDVTIVNNLAESMLKDPNMLGGMQQATTPGSTASPAAAASPAGASATPAAASSPAAAASPAAASTPAPTPRAAAATPTPRAAATPRPASTPRPAATAAATPGGE